MQQYDVAIVGARIAGATLAALLGDAGYRVLLIDRAAFPSATLSTHFFRGAHAVAVLQRLGVLDEVLALDCPPLTRQYMYSNGLPEPAVGPPQDPGTIGYALSVRRESLDHILVRRAAAVPTVEVMERTRATELLYDDGRVTGLRLSGSDGDRTVRARIVVGADGRHSFVARSVKPTAELSHPPFRAAYYCYVSNFPGPEGRPSDGPEFSMLGSEIAYVFPSDAGVTCVALTIDLNEYPALNPRSASTSPAIRAWPSASRRQHGRAACSRAGLNPTGCANRLAPAGRSPATPEYTRTRGAATGSTWPPCTPPSWPRASATGSAAQRPKTTRWQPTTSAVTLTVWMPTTRRSPWRTPSWTHHVADTPAVGHMGRAVMATHSGREVIRASLGG
jgi:flavin-dependent dehydrogenase